MLRKMSLYSALIGLLSLGLVGTAFAVQGNNIATEAGNYEFHFDATSTNSNGAALTNDYDADRLADVGTEAGNWEYSFDESNTSADQVASDNYYELEELTNVGTEAGSWEMNANEMDLHCQTC